MRHFIFIAILMMILAGCGTKSEVFKAAADKAIQAGSHKEAVNIYKSAAKKNVDNSAYYEGLADIHYSYGYYVEAVNSYTRAIRINGRAEYHLKRGRAYMKLHIYRDAILDFEYAIDSKGAKLPVAYVERAMAYVGKGDFKRAMKDMKRAERRSGDTVEFDVAMGELYFKMGKYDSAKASIQKAIIKDADNADLYYLRGRVFYKSKDANQAISDLKKALKLSRVHVDAKRMLAWIYATNPLDTYRNGKEAVRLSKELFEMNEDVEYIEVLAAAYAEVGDFENAIKTLENGIRISSDLVQSEDFRFDIKNYEQGRHIRSW